MTTNEITRVLHELELPGMASCWNSLEETHQLDILTLREGMQQMMQYERDTRQDNRIQHLIKNVDFRLKASIEELETDTRLISSARSTHMICSSSMILAW